MLNLIKFVDDEINNSILKISAECFENFSEISIEEISKNIQDF